MKKRRISQIPPEGKGTWNALLRKKGMNTEKEFNLRGGSERGDIVTLIGVEERREGERDRNARYDQTITRKNVVGSKRFQGVGSQISSRRGNKDRRGQIEWGRYHDIHTPCVSRKTGRAGAGNAPCKSIRRTTAMG